MANGRYRVRVYRADKTVKTGRKLANANQNGGTSLLGALKSVTAEIEKAGDNANRIVRIMIDQELPSENGADLGLSLSDPPAAATETVPAGSEAATDAQNAPSGQAPADSSKGGGKKK